MTWQRRLGVWMFLVLAFLWWFKAGDSTNALVCLCISAVCANGSES